MPEPVPVCTTFSVPTPRGTVSGRGLTVILRDDVAGSCARTEKASAMPGSNTDHFLLVDLLLLFFAVFFLVFFRCLIDVGFFFDSLRSVGYAIINRRSVTNSIP